jgi:hypothetical protein
VGRDDGDAAPKGRARKRWKMKKLFFAAVLAAGLAVVGAAGAATSPYVTSGTATVNADGSVTLGAGGAINLLVPGGTKVGDLSSLAADFTFPSGCPTGAPVLAITTVRGTFTVPVLVGCTSTVQHVEILGPGAPADTSADKAGSAADTWRHAQGEYDNLAVLAVAIRSSGTVTVANFFLGGTIPTPGPSM